MNESTRIEGRWEGGKEGNKSEELFERMRRGRTGMAE
jgi:hypothetical protein